MKQIYIYGKKKTNVFLLVFFMLSYSQFAFSFNDGGTIGSDQTVNLNDIPAALTETAPPTIAGPYEYLWMVSVPSIPSQIEWAPLTGATYIASATDQDLVFTDFLSVTSLFTRCVRLAGSTDNYVETNVVVITVNNVLPIDLISFDAKDNRDGTVQLNWITATETNNEYFDLESSTNGIEFHSITRIEGALNSAELKSYTYKDENPKFGNNYYRLKQVDTDGSYEYSEIASIRITSGFSDDFSVFPNPVSKDLNLKVNYPMEENASIFLINSIGEIVFEARTTSDSIMRFSLDKLPPSIYLLRVLEKGEVIFQEKVTKVF